MAFGCIQVEKLFPLNVAAGDIEGAGCPAFQASKMSGAKKTPKPQTKKQNKKNPQIQPKTQTKLSNK